MAKKCTAIEHENRVQKVVMMLAEGYTRAAVAMWMRDKYKLCADQVDHYIAKAKARRIDEFAKAKALHREDQYWALRAIAENPANAVASRVRARELIGKLLALDEPAKSSAVSSMGVTDYSGINYDEIFAEASEQELMVLYSIHERAKQRAISVAEKSIIDSVAVPHAESQVQSD